MGWTGFFSNDRNPKNKAKITTRVIYLPYKSIVLKFIKYTSVTNTYIL